MTYEISTRRITQRTLARYFVNLKVAFSFSQSKE